MLCGRNGRRRDFGSQRTWRSKRLRVFDGEILAGIRGCTLVVLGEGGSTVSSDTFDREKVKGETNTNRKSLPSRPRDPDIRDSF